MQPIATPGVVPDERRRLAALIDRFRCGQLSLRRLRRETDAFAGATDRAVAHIADALDGLRLRWTRLRPAEREWIDRCRRFLDTSLPYEWPDLPAALWQELAQAGLALLWSGAAAFALFGLALGIIGICVGPAILILHAVTTGTVAGVAIAVAVVARRALREWVADTRQCHAAAGDPGVWPFVRREDYDRACRGHRMP